MTLSTLPELVAVCGDAPDPLHRSAAHTLLAREMMARLATTDRNWDRRREGYPLHPARQALDGIGTNGGLGPATFYRRHQNGHWAISTTQTPAPELPYFTELAAIEAEAAQLISEATGDMGGAYFEASRDRLVAYALIGGSWDAVEPGQPFAMRMLAVPPAGYSVSGSALTVPTAGDYHVRFDGQLWSTSTSAGTDVILAYYDNAALETSSTIEREGNHPEDPAQSVVFSTSHDISLAGVLSVRNGSGTHNQFAHGILRIFEVP